MSNRSRYTYPALTMSDMQRLYPMRNRTTIVAETLKWKVVEDRAVDFRQRFAAAALEILTN